ncbi:MAG TPA: M14 metallopeptidase family protein [Salinimicrobium sp.]|nr:M14 metallopeptidase family protein [Salinimicrobium sp.]
MIVGQLTAQSGDFSERLYNTYEQFKEETLKDRRFKHSDIMPLIEQYRENEQFSVKKVGESIEGRSLNLISIGEGEKDILLWSQMHGDESTATMAIFDILNFLDSKEFTDEKEMILDKVRLHFLPMLNPDGAENFQRRNALGIDINRDALRLQSPESKTLKRIRDSLPADFGFNLHDQSRYYNAARTQEPASISFLAPAFDYEKTIDRGRKEAMKIIVAMNEVIQEYAPGKVGRYSDDFEPRAFGDNIQKWGTTTILIESGGYPDDREKQEIRKLNYMAILSAIKAISTGDYKSESVADYEKIPENDRMLFDLKIKGITYELNGEDYILDLGINRSEHDFNDSQDFYYSGRIEDQGDLSTSYGYENFDSTGYRLKMGKIYPEILADVSAVEKLDLESLLKEGYAYIRIKELPQYNNYTEFPVHLVQEYFKVPQDLQPGRNATFFLEKDGEIEYAIINGFLFKPEELWSDKNGNALIFRR